MITIKDVAKECGVATSTVSRALADSKLLPAETKERIKRIAREMGYIKNQLATSLKTGVNNTVGVINFVDENLGYAHYLFSEVLNGFALRVDELGYEILLISQKTLEMKDLIQHLKSKRLGGVLILSGHLESEGMRKIYDSDIPTVTVDPRDDRILKLSNCISSQNYEGMFRLTENIIEKGHKNIVYVTGEDYYVTAERKRGFLGALNSSGIEFKDDMIVKGNYYKLKSVERIIDELLSRQTPPSCIIFSDDYCAVHAYEVLRARNKIIGEDISVAGFDGIELGMHMQPKVTTVMQNAIKMGRLAADTLVSSICGEKRRVYTEIETEVVATDSVLRF